jgi:NUDIX domain
MGTPKTPVEDLDSLPISPALRECARNLKTHVFAEPEVSMWVTAEWKLGSVSQSLTVPASSAKPPPQFPIGRLAAVLILLYEREGIIRVLLTTRSKNLRSHPGQVALPGGKSDPADGTPFGTAVRHQLPSPEFIGSEQATYPAPDIKSYERQMKRSICLLTHPMCIFFGRYLRSLPCTSSS